MASSTKRELAIDIETYSGSDLSKCGVYRYVEDPEFRVLLFGYSVDGSPVRVVDLAKGEEIPGEILGMLTDGSVVKWAFNASFERVCLSRLLGYPTGRYLDPGQWHCSMVLCSYDGLPLSLRDAGMALGLDRQKLDGGKELVRHFCAPCKPTKANGMRARNTPLTDPEKWERFKLYNRRDVEAENDIRARLRKYPAPDSLWEEYAIDQRINDSGVRIDLGLVSKAIAMDAKTHAEISDALKAMTDLENPNSVPQLKDWLLRNGLPAGSLGRKDVSKMRAAASDPRVAEVLGLRLSAAKSSVRKYEAMMNSVCSDGRCRGMFFFYGAKTGRWAGRLVQLQNLPQNHIEDLEEARALVEAGDADAVKLLDGDVPDVLSQLIRTAFIPAEGNKFIVADFSAIEARVIAWLAGERWRMDAFASGEDIYCASASRMFGVPVVKHGINGHLRQKGKIAELALGYGGSVGALKAMGALDMGLKEEELQPLVDSWRKSNPRITEFWWDVDKAAADCIRRHSTEATHGLTFEWRGDMMFVTLLSGRRLAYAKPRIGENRFGAPSITYMGVGATRKWERIETYGPKLVENIVQATSRDVLANSMRGLLKEKVVMHIHDELVIDAGMDESLDEVSRRMATVPEWAPGLILRADGYECEFYKKD